MHMAIILLCAGCAKRDVLRGGGGGRAVYQGWPYLVAGVDAHDRGAHETHSPRDSVAVLIQLVEGLVAGLDQVHAHALDHVIEGLDGHWEAGDCLSQSRIQDVIGLALKCGL